MVSDDFRSGFGSSREEYQKNRQESLKTTQEPCHVRALLSETHVQSLGVPLMRLVQPVLVDADKEASDIVVAAGLIGGLDQPRTDFFERCWTGRRGI